MLRSPNTHDSRVIKLCLGFPKGIYVYRKIIRAYFQNPKGLYVLRGHFTYNPFGIFGTYLVFFL
jgi:hypothetical protein